MRLFTSIFLSSLAVAGPVTRRQYTGGSSENQLTDATPCRAITVLFARGTTEQGNVGTYAGPQFFQAIANDVGSSNVAVQGVDYGATVDGFFEGGDPAGSTLLAQLVGQVQSQCPKTKLVVSGYSQGGQLVHNAAKQLNASETAFVNSVVIFGDPDNGQAVGSIPSSKVLIICHAGDDICQGGDTILAAHLNYSENATQAASFVVSKAGL